MTMQKNPPLSPQQGNARDLRHLLMEVEDNKVSTEPAQSVWLEHLYPDEPLLQQETITDVPDLKRESPTAQPRKVDLPRGARSQQRAVFRPSRDKKGVKQTTQPELGLNNLIRSKNLPLAIIAAEVLGAPRSKKPYSQRNRV